MGSKTLSSQEVQLIRDHLGLSQAEIARQIDVSEDTIRKWENGDRQCSGSGSLLLQLLKYDSGILTVLKQDAPRRLPRPTAVKGTREWAELQRLLAVIGFGGGYAYWSEVFVEEKLTNEWYMEMLDAEYLRQSSSNSKIILASEVAAITFDLSNYLQMIREKNIKYTNDYPVLRP